MAIHLWNGVAQQLSFFHSKVLRCQWCDETVALNFHQERICVRQTYWRVNN